MRKVKAMKKTGRRERLWIVFILGFLLSLFGLAPRGPIEEREVYFSTPILQPPVKKFEVPTPEPRETLSPWSRPFLFQLADTDKISGLQREAKLRARYDEIRASLGPNRVPEVAVADHQQVAVVTIDGKPFATVLPQDCPEYFGRLDPAGQHQLEIEVAYSWAQVLADDLTIRSGKLHPVYLKFYNWVAAVTFFLVGLLHLFVSWISRRFVQTPLWSIKALIWVAWGSFITYFHPSLDEFSTIISRGALRPLFLFIVCGVSAMLAHHFAIAALHRYLAALAAFDSDEKLTQRTAQRRKTIEQAITFVSALLWTFLALCGYLYLLGVDLTAFFAGAGLIGVAIGVMARDIFLDFFSGLNILTEDQFGVGDWIDNDKDTGEVVRFTLRSTKIRRVDGSLATIPNSELRSVKNHSNQWSQVDYRVAVSYRCDVDRALACLSEEIERLYQDMPEKILESARILGLEELSVDGVTIRALIKTSPLNQWSVRRELNRRIKNRFDQEGLEFATRRLSVHMRPSNERDAFLAPNAQAPSATEPPE